MLATRKICVVQLLLIRQLAAGYAMLAKPVVTPAYHRIKSVISRRDVLVMGNTPI
jgi:hypothetical protein